MGFGLSLQYRNYVGYEGDNGDQDRRHAEKEFYIHGWRSTRLVATCLNHRRRGGAIAGDIGASEKSAALGSGKNHNAGNFLGIGGTP